MKFAHFVNFVASLVLPVWSLSVIGLGLAYMSFAWLVCGAGIGVVAFVLLAGNPVFARCPSETGCDQVQTASR